MSDHAFSNEVCLVVGAAGFLGRSLVQRLLDEGFTVRAFDRVASPTHDSRVEVHVGDMRDPEVVDRVVRGAHTVFHAAATINLLGVARRKTRDTAMSVNVGGTRCLLEAARRHGVWAFVYTSTNNVCFDRAIIDGDERSAYASHFVDLYTESKVAAEKLVLAADGEGGVRTCALRPGGLWGPGPGSLMIDEFVETLARGRLVATIGDGSAVADNTHVENLVDAELLAARALVERPDVVGGHAYFITDGEPMNPVEWFRPLCEGLGYELPKRKLPARLMYGVGHAAEWLHFLFGIEPMLTRMAVLKITRTHSFRIEKARSELGYVPRVTLANGGIEACLPQCRELVAHCL